MFEEEDKTSYPVMPMHHTRASAASTKLGSAAGEGLSGAAKGGLFGFSTGAIIGAVVLGSIALLLVNPGAAAFIFGGSGSAEAIGATTIFALKTAAVACAAFVGAKALGAFGFFTGAGIGGLFGIGKGLKDGSDQVSQERSAAMAMDQQIAISNAQTQMMMLQAASAPRHEPLIPQGHAMNQAVPSFNAKDIAEHSMLAQNRQLQMAGA